MKKKILPKPMKKNFLKENYISSFKYLRESWKPISFVIAIFLIFFIIGFFIPAPKVISSQLLDYIRQLLEQTKDFGFGEMFSFIFVNNLKISFFSLIIGILFGIFPLFNSMSNGYILGFVANMSVGINGISSLWRIFPHGIFELPAVFISLGLGLKLGSFFLKDNKKEFLRENFKKSFRAFVLIVLPLLVIAAIIECLLIFLV